MRRLVRLCLFLTVWLPLALAGCNQPVDQPNNAAPAPKTAAAPDAQPAITTESGAHYGLLLLLPNGAAYADTVKAGAESVAPANESTVTNASADVKPEAFAAAIKANDKLNAVLVGGPSDAVAAAVKAAAAAKLPVIVLGGAKVDGATCQLAPGTELAKVDAAQATAFGRCGVETAFGKLYGDETPATRPLEEIR